MARKKKRWLIIIAVVVIAASAVAYAAISKGNGNGEEEKGPEIPTLAASIEDVQVIVREVGTVGRIGTGGSVDGSSGGPEEPRGGSLRLAEQIEVMQAVREASGSDRDSVSVHARDESQQGRDMSRPYNGRLRLSVGAAYMPPSGEGSLPTLITVIRHPGSRVGFQFSSGGRRLCEGGGLGGSAPLRFFVWAAGDCRL